MVTGSENSTPASPTPSERLWRLVPLIGPITAALLAWILKDKPNDLPRWFTMAMLVLALALLVFTLASLLGIPGRLYSLWTAALERRMIRRFHPDFLAFVDELHGILTGDNLGWYIKYLFRDHAKNPLAIATFDFHATHLRDLARSLRDLVHEPPHSTRRFANQVAAFEAILRLYHDEYVCTHVRSLIELSREVDLFNPNDLPRYQELKHQHLAMMDRWLTFAKQINRTLPATANLTTYQHPPNLPAPLPPPTLPT